MTYISIDVETDGPCPGVNSLLQLGAVAFGEEGQELSSWESNLELLPDAQPDPETKEWWVAQGEAYINTRIDPCPVEVAMRSFCTWVESNPKPRIAIAYPSGFDFTWVYWYCHKFAGRSPFGFQSLDIKTLASAALRSPLSSSSKKNMPKRWFEGLPAHTHDALDDAREQGLLFFNIWKEVRDGIPPAH